MKRAANEISASVRVHVTSGSSRQGQAADGQSPRKQIHRARTYFHRIVEFLIAARDRSFSSEKRVRLAWNHTVIERTS